MKRPAGPATDSGETVAPEPQRTSPASADPDEPEPESEGPTTFRENLRIVLPLFFVGAAALLLTIYLFRAAGSFQSSRIPLWLLSLSIGIVATAGASTALFFGDFSPPGEGIGSAAVRSGDYVLVARRDWERMRRRPRPLEPWDEAPAEDDGSDLEFVGDDDGAEPPAPPEFPPRGAPLWEEPGPDPETARRVGRANRATDRLAREVDDLVHTLTRLSAPAPGGVAVAGGLLPPPGASEGPKRQYETLLAQLRAEAERAGGAETRTLRCAGCGTAIEMRSGWEPCNACWRTYCARCASDARGQGPAFVCPGCGHAS